MKLGRFVLNDVYLGNCLELLKDVPDGSVDLIFADPPYNLQLKGDLYRPNQTKVDGVFDEWDRFESFEEYDEFTTKWLTECKRVLKDTGTIWVIGTYHNIFRVGKIMQDLGFWILNDIVWIKTNPMPNFKGTRFTNSHETLIWAAKSQSSKYSFHYKAMKVFNDDTQMRSEWYIPICQGEERIKVNGKKVHSTQKPEALLYRVIISSSNMGDIVLDPFAGTGTTLAVAKKLRRNFIGFEKNETYYNVCKERLSKVVPIAKELLKYPVEHQHVKPKVPFGALVEQGIINVGEYLYSKDRKHKAVVLADGSIVYNGQSGSIHKISAFILSKERFNGWEFWFVERDGRMVSIDQLRQQFWEQNQRSKDEIQHEV